MNTTETAVAIALPILAASPFVYSAYLHWLRTRPTCPGKAYPGGTLDPKAWFIGPHLRGWCGRHGSQGMPDHPGDGWVIDLPVGVDLPLGTGSKLDYTTFHHGTLTGKRSVTFTYRLDTTADVLAVPEENPTGRYPARITPHFQRKGDDWSGEGKYEPYRWYYTSEVFYLQPGTHTIAVPLDSGWTAVESSTIASKPAEFKAAIDEAWALGFVFGGNEIGLGHGIRATGPAKLSLLKFEVV